jgi:hypothetical protein
MAIFKPKIKETTEDRLQKAINLGREEALKEVLEWLCKNFSDVHVLHDDRVEGNFENKEEMLKSFKERFNIE